MKRLALLVLAACGHAAPTPTPDNHGGAPPDAAAAPTARCLPVVSGDCGCSYPCHVGDPAGARWVLSWGDGKVDADVTRWCIDRACTDAFYADLVCDGVCPITAADPTCHFDSGGACVSGR